MNPGPAEVDLALTAVLHDGHRVRLVLRRRVGASLGDGHDVSVEELWVSEPCPSPFAVADVLRHALDRCGRDLVRGRAVVAPPGLTSPTTAELVELSRAAERRTVGVEYLAGYRGTVDGLWDGRPVLRAGDVLTTDGFLGVRARHLLVDVIRGLAVPDRPRPALATERAPVVPAPPDRRAVRADLLRELADARRRLDQERSWARLATTHLQFVYGGGSRPAPGWSRAVRRTPDGAALDVADGPDGGHNRHDTVAAVFVQGHGGRVDLYRYRVDPGVDLPAALDDARVRSAFAACAARPDDAVAQARAVAALGAADRRPESADDGADPGLPMPGHVVPASPVSGGAVVALDGVVVLHDCRAIAAGNDDRRFNTFAYVFTPAATTEEVLRAAPEIVESIVDRSCRVDDTARSRLRNALAAAVCADAPPLEPAVATR